MNPPPIETYWRGWRFRSRLEARWAIFLTELGIEFWYEPDAFKRRNGQQYLPDFLFPRVIMFAEVKPFELTPEELDKARGLATLADREVLLLVGPPDFRVYEGVFPSHGNGEIAPVSTTYLLDIDYHGRRYYDRERRFFCSPGDQFTSEEQFSEQYRMAVYASRAARFEEAAA